MEDHIFGSGSAVLTWRSVEKEDPTIHVVEQPIADFFNLFNQCCGSGSEPLEPPNSGSRGRKIKENNIICYKELFNN